MRILDYVFVTMEGTLAQWQAYLSDRSLRPKSFEHLKLEIDSHQRLRLASPRFELEVPPELLKLSKDSALRLNFGFFRDGERVVWDVAGLALGEGFHERNWINFWRASAPSSSLPEDFQATWRKLVAHEFPYNATIVTENGETRIETDVAKADTAKIRYGLRVYTGGDQQQAAMSEKLERLKNGFRVLE
jgi:hypothetical protein